MFKGFQQTGQSKITFNPSQMFNGFPHNNFAQSPNPFIVNEGIIAWWDSVTNVTLNSTTVSAWQDKIGGFILSQPTAINQPSYIAADGNYRGYPSINFNSTSQYLDAGNVLNIGTLAGMTICLVVKPITSGGQRIFGKYGGYSGDYLMGWNNTSALYYVDGSGAHSPSTSQTLTGGQIISSVIDRSGGFCYIYNSLNSVASTAISTALTNLVPSDNLQLNQQGGAQTFVALEIIVYNRALTAIEINQNNTNLRAKYGF